MYKSVHLRNRQIHLLKLRYKKFHLKLKLQDYAYLALFLLVVAGLAQRSISKADELLSPLFVPNKAEVYAQAMVAPSPTPTPVIDFRIQKLKTFLESKNSPLAPYAAYIIEQADKYDIGWTKIVAISSMESDYGKNCPKTSHNAWGIGKPFFYFDSWEKGIEYASELLGNHYQYNANSGIKSKYCPASDNCNPKWADHVTNISKEILALKGGE